MATQFLLNTAYSTQRRWSKHWPFHRGKGLPAAVARWVFKHASPIWVQLEPNVKMLLDPADLICRVLLETGEWDAATWAAIAEHLEPGGTFVDVGAHIGHCSLKAAAITGPGGRVVAIEANPETAQRLRANITASSARVDVQEFACAASESVLDLYSADRSNSGSSSLSSSNASSWGPPSAQHRVHAMPLDTLLEGKVSRVDVLKIDVEGTELEVLKGAEETLKRYRPVLVIELDDQLLQSVGTSMSEVKTHLARCGYQLRASFDGANYKFVPTN
jgi:FkbM family methyltransferase